MLEWYTKKDPEAEKLIAAAGENHKMTSPEIQLELCKACAQETSKAIIEDIGDRKFALLVDESRDVSIKEQMAMCLRSVPCLVLYVCVVCIFSQDCHIFIMLLCLM
jgi:hypothetical protein